MPPVLASRICCRQDGLRSSTWRNQGVPVSGAAPSCKSSLRPACRTAGISCPRVQARRLPELDESSRTSRVNRKLDRRTQTMRRISTVFVTLMLVALVTLGVQAQQPAHLVAMPDTLKWVEPAVLPGARLAVVQGDPGKEGLFV